MKVTHTPNLSFHDNKMVSFLASITFESILIKVLKVVTVCMYEDSRRMISRTFLLTSIVLFHLFHCFPTF